MSIGEAIREARKYRGLTQNEAGNIGYVSGKMVSAIECGQRPAGADILERLTTSLDHPRLYMEAVEQVTGGVYCSPWLDGEGVDLHRASVWGKTCEELHEAVKAVSEVDVINAPIRANEDRREMILQSIFQVLDARVASDHYVAIMCQEYGFSLQDLYREHRKKLESRGYIKPRRKRKRAF